MTLVRGNPQVDCWSMSCFTYWKSYQYRVDPPEPTPLVVFVRLGAGRFTDCRLYQAERYFTLPVDTARFHHMSYARTDAQILRKITTFGHAREVVPGWFENVWRKWDDDRSLRNLNPCWPRAYQASSTSRTTHCLPAMPPDLDASGCDAGHATLSVCLITKNEEAHLARCLESVRGLR